MATEEFSEGVESIRRQVENKLTEIISDLLRHKLFNISPEAGLEDEIGLDSIHRVELSTRISRIYGITAGVEEMDDVETFGELADIIVQAALAAGRKQGQNP
ncbi:acyl carrier protein [Streptomyces lavendulae]|uniref:acyl carrier protein n=1 Tax=Streptomyces lavendulae TaxID=1914 RepID=UPI0024A52AE8|nr:acyl carrier protein [Streptomyces lavendulae]GLW04660.1 hypothetical protein Slala05_82900 [Streptomyces lavendulae subsp. lavendulae]